VWASTGMLVHHLESFTDSLVVTDGERPVGFFGGKEVMEETLKHNFVARWKFYHKAR